MRAAPFEDDDDVRVRVIDEGGLDDDLAPPVRRWRGAIVALAAAAALVVLGVVVIARGDGGGQELSRASVLREYARSSEREIIRVGNAWAHSRRSFRGAKVADVELEGRRAMVRFSNGVTVEFVDGGPHSPWQVHSVGGGLRLQRQPTPEEDVTRYGNEWARLFADTSGPACNRLMTQPVCERVPACASTSGPAENCDPRMLEFRRSFRATTVREAVVKGRRAAVRFSNGVLVDFELVESGDGSREWWVAKLGRKARRG